MIAGRSKRAGCEIDGSDAAWPLEMAVLQVAISLESLGVHADDAVGLSVTLLADNQVVQRLPEKGEAILALRQIESSEYELTGGQ